MNNSGVSRSLLYDSIRLSLQGSAIQLIAIIEDGNFNRLLILVLIHVFLGASEKMSQSRKVNAVVSRRVEPADSLRPGLILQGFGFPPPPPAPRCRLFLDLPLALARGRPRRHERRREIAPGLQRIGGSHLPPSHVHKALPVRGRGGHPSPAGPLLGPCWAPGASFDTAAHRRTNQARPLAPPPNKCEERAATLCPPVLAASSVRDRHHGGSGGGSEQSARSGPDTPLIRGRASLIPDSCFSPAARTSTPRPTR